MTSLPKEKKEQTLYGLPEQGGKGKSQIRVSPDANVGLCSMRLGKFADCAIHSVFWWEREGEKKIEEFHDLPERKKKKKKKKRETTTT